jgi:hypothetical protein
MGAPPAIAWNGSVRYIRRRPDRRVADAWGLYNMQRKGEKMTLTPHLSFNGECEAAFKFYERCLVARSSQC